MRPKSTPSVRATRGRRSGPITTSATMPITSISENPTSNMAAGGAAGARGARRSALLLFLDLALDRAALRLRGGELARGLGRLVAAHAVLEPLHRAAEVGAD